MTAIKPHLLKYLAAALIFAIAMGMRFGAISQTTVDNPLRADAGYYYLYALHLKYHHTFAGTEFRMQEVPKPDALRAPLYPLFLSAFVVVPPTDFMIWKILLAQALLGSLTVVLALSVFRRLMPEGWALTAALLTALSPHLVMADNYLLSESLFTFLLVLSLWLFTRMHENSSRALALLAGIIIAMAALTRPTLQYFIVPLFIMLALGTGKRINLRLALPLLLGFILAFTPWSIRNLYQTGSMSDPTLTTTSLHHGMYPDFRYQGIPESTGFPYRFDPRSGEIVSSRENVLDEIRRRFKDEPARHLQWYLLGKPASLFDWDVLTGTGDVFIYPVDASPYLSQPVYLQSHRLMEWLHWPLVMLALAASVLVWLPGPARRLSGTSLVTARLLSLLMLYFIALHIVAAPYPRYSIPLRPVIYGLALFLCSQVFVRLKTSRQPEAGTHPDNTRIHADSSP